MASSSNG